VGVDDGSDDVAGVDVDHHIGVEVGALDRPGELGDIPAVNLTGGGGDQLGTDPGRVAGQPPSFPHLAVFAKDPVHRGDRAQVTVLVQELGVDLQRWLVNEAG